jgi:hypothetical protein
MSVLDVWTWPRGDVPGLGLTDGDVGLLRGVDCDILTQGLIGLIEYCFAKKRIDRILIPSRYTFFSGSPTTKNYEVKRAWPEAILGWVTEREVFPSAHE